MATRAKAKTKKKTTKKATAKKAVARKKAARVSRSLSGKDATAVRKAAEALWDASGKPHTLVQEVHELLLLRCLQEAEGNYAQAANLFGPSRQSVQQYANSTLRDERWRPYQQNKRKR